MIKFDHLRLPVTDLARSRDWYIRTLGDGALVRLWDERSMREN